LNLGGDTVADKNKDMVTNRPEQGLEGLDTAEIVNVVASLP
jgi:hypothetical protein